MSRDTHHTYDESDEDNVKSNVDERQYAQRHLVGHVSDMRRDGGGDYVDDGMPYADAAQYTHGRKYVFVLH